MYCPTTLKQRTIVYRHYQLYCLMTFKISQNVSYLQHDFQYGNNNLNRYENKKTYIDQRNVYALSMSMIQCWSVIECHQLTAKLQLNAGSLVYYRVTISQTDRYQFNRVGPKTALHSRTP